MSDPIQITPAFYWDLSDFPDFIKTELNRRIKFNSGKFSYDATISPDSKYTAPLSIWARVCSNTNINGKAGFVMGGLETSGFKQMYGIGTNLNGTVLGYTPDGMKHIIENERYKHRPAPGILSIDTELSGGDGKFRITTIKWICWSTDQLNYMTPYFLTNGVSMSVEFGWNIAKQESLLPISNENELLKYFFNEDPKVNIPELIKKSFGNYDGSMGIISDSDSKIRSDGGFDCVTVVKNVGGFFSGVYSTSRNSSETESPTSQTEEIKTYIKKLFNKTPDLARKYHMGEAVVKGVGRSGGVIKLTNETYQKNSIIGQVFYKRGGQTPAKRVSQGQPKDFDFDKNNDNWWISFGYLIRILNVKCSVKSGIQELFKIDIDSAVISGHPNIVSNNGSVLLIPNTNTPQILIRDIQNETDAPRKNIVNPTGDVELDEANKILISQSKYFYKTGNLINVTRVDANDIINWWSDDKSSLAFPAISEDINIKQKYHSGYLKNLYVSKDVIINAVESCNTFRDIIMNILEQISRAAGDIWSFEIVPLNPNGHDNGTMTIIDRNSLNGYSPKKEIFNFEINTPKNVVRDIEFSVKTTDAVTVQTLFGQEENGKYISQDFKLPIALKKNDRLIKNLIPAGKTDVEIQQEQEESLKRKSLGNERIPTKESSKFFFYTKPDKVTYMLAEPNEEIQRGLMFSGDKSPLRYSCVQPGITLGITLQGISGIVNLNTFTVTELPFPYGTRCFFQVQNVKHVIHNGNWETKISAGIRLKPEFAGQ